MLSVNNLASRGLLICLLFSLLLVSSYAALAQSQFLTYQDPNGLFTIQYPSNWNIDLSKYGSIMFRAPQETFNDRYEINAAVDISTNNLPSMTNSLQDLTDYKLKTSFTSVEKKVLESKETILAGLPAYMVVKEIESPGVINIGMGTQQKIMEVWTIKGDKWYDILFMAPVENYERYFPIVHTMLDSIQITG